MGKRGQSLGGRRAWAAGQGPGPGGSGHQGYAPQRPRGLGALAGGEGLGYFAPKGPALARRPAAAAKTRAAAGQAPGGARGLGCFFLNRLGLRL